MNRNKLKDNYEKACNDYVQEFCKKQDLEFIGWAASEVGGVAMVSDFFFNFRDIAYDVNSNQPKGRIIQWYDYALENIEKSVNYHTYTIAVK